MRRRVFLAAAGALVLIACRRGAPAPAELDTRNDTCATCRMPVSDRRLAAQLVATGREPAFFDDLGCLREHLGGRAPGPKEAIYVADHLSGAWVPAERAVYTRCPALSTPMGSGLVAHADASSRDRDRATRGGVPVTISEALGLTAAGAGGRTP
ncbi:MAG TPA: hypothetical protein VMQ61_14235 [Thermoanaerobaculia bacterium]|nr:hypothetical protein [Thermoanaerobaculia bacterium]